MAKVNVGDRFDKLTVLERCDVPSKIKKRDSEGKVYYEIGKNMNIAWICKCDCGEITKPIRQSTLIKKTAFLRSCGKCPKEKNENYTPPNMDKKEFEYFNELYEYVRTNLLGYDKSQSLTRDMVARLKGLATGNYKINKKISANANYSYEIVLNTFKFCSQSIHKALRTINFDSEQRKFNYITKIVENNINNVYLRMQNVEKSKEQIENTITEMVAYDGAEYQRKTKESTNKLLDDLW